MNLDNRSDIKKIYSGYKGAGRAVYVLSNFYNDFEKIRREHLTNYHMTSIMRQIVSLNANPINGNRINHGGDSYECTQGNIFMQYDIFKSAVIINYLAINTIKPDERFGLYSVAWDENELNWSASETPKTTFEKSHQWKSKSGKAHYAAVAGRFDKISDAAQKLPEHVIGGYVKAQYFVPSDIEKKDIPLSMFWIKKGQHKSPATADALASIMQQSSASELPVNWLVHDAGTDTFKAAARILSKKPLADAKARALDSKAGTIQGQNVYFSNPNTSSINELEQLCQQAGFNYVGMHTNNRDLRRLSTMKNVCLDMGKTVSLGLAGGAGGGAIVQSLVSNSLGTGNVEKVVKNGVDALLNGNYFLAAATVVASGYICLGIYNKSKTITAGVRCTFGKGNQKWYTSDADFTR